MENPSNSQFGPFLLDVRERVLRRDGQPVPVTPKAFDLLAALVEQPGRLISKEELLQKVWPDTFVEEANLAYNVFALRKALGDTADNGQYIETIAKKRVPVHCHRGAHDTWEWRIAICRRVSHRRRAGSSRRRDGASRERQTAANYQQHRMFGGTSLAARFGRSHG